MRKVELLLHNIRSVYNVASIFRTAECLGVSKIWVSGYTPAPIDRFGRARSDFAKVSLGTEKDIEWEQIQTVAELLVDKKQAGFRIVALEQATESTWLEDYTHSGHTLLIPGTETDGVDQAVLDQVEEVIEIRQQGNKESLNVASATAIALWQLLK